MNNIKIKLITLFLLIIFLVIIGVIINQDFQISKLSIKEIKETRELKEQLVEIKSINGKSLAYDKASNTYFYIIPAKYEKSTQKIKLDINKKYKYKIKNQNNNEIIVDYSKPIDVIIYNDLYYCETKIQLTNLSIIIIGTDEVINTEDLKSTFSYFDGISKDKTYNSKIHIRGGSSLQVPKKSYRLNIYDGDYKQNKSINIKGFNEQDSFIIDGIYKDTSKIRNILSSELWNDISRDFLGIKINYKFVELFINTEYKGLYILTDPINRKKLGLKKNDGVDTSVIIKDGSWESISSNDLNFDTSLNKYKGYEIKYPNDNEYNNLIWSKFLSKLSSYYDNESKYDIVKNIFNIDNYIDIIIYNSFINNTDNMLKTNNYFYMESINDEQIYIQPWDMEFTFGLMYSGGVETKSVKTLKDWNEIKVPMKLDNKLRKLVVKRYWELRKTVLTKEYFDKLLDNYLNELNKGAAKRDSDLWYEYDIEQEIEEIRTWIYNRLDFFDDYIRSLENE